MGTLFSLSKSVTSIALDTSEIVLLLFGVLLTVGLIGEYAKSERWKRHVKTFEMLVIIGVAGELLADGGIFLFSSHLQTIADQEIADLTVTAGNARASAETAAKATDRAKASADEAKQKADAAGRAADTAKEKVEAVAKRAEEIDAGLAQTQWLMSARYFPKPDALTGQLRQFKGQAVSIRSYVGDGEGWGVCTALWYAAHAADMSAANECGMSPATVQPFFGISITGPDDKVMESLSKIIGQSGVFGGASSGPYGNAPHSPTLVIFVGSKSPFMIGQARGVKVPPKKQAKKKSAPSKL